MPDRLTSENAHQFLLTSADDIAAADGLAEGAQFNVEMQKHYLEIRRAGAFMNGKAKGMTNDQAEAHALEQTNEEAIKLIELQSVKRRREIEADRLKNRRMDAHALFKKFGEGQ